MDITGPRDALRTHEEIIDEDKPTTSTSGRLAEYSMVAVRQHKWKLRAPPFVVALQIYDFVLRKPLNQQVVA